jgi:hypothetical protein
MLGGKTGILKTMIVAFITGIIVSAIQSGFHIMGGFVSFILLIWIYHEMFRLGWFRAFLTWVLQLIFIVIFYIMLALILAFLIGVSVFTFI